MSRARRAAALSGAELLERLGKIRSGPGLVEPTTEEVVRHSRVIQAANRFLRERGEEPDPDLLSDPEALPLPPFLRPRPIVRLPAPPGLTSRWYALRPHREQWRLWNSPARFCVVPAGRRSGKCLVAGTKVAMADGTWKAVEAIRPGDLVFALGEDYKLSPRAVSHTQPNGRRPVIRIRTTGRDITCSLNHPFLADNCWTEAADIKPGALIAVARKTEAAAPESMDSDELDFLAIWLAEGAAYTIASGTPAIVDIVHEISRKWGLTPTKHGATKGDSSNVSWYLAGGQRTGGRRVTHPVRLLLERHGLWGKNARNKNIPAAIFKLPQEQLARFLNLFIACDGCIHTRGGGGQPTVEIGLASRELLLDISRLFLRFGIRGQFRQHKHNGFDRRGERYRSWIYAFSDAASIMTFGQRIGATGKEARVDEAMKIAASSAGSCNSYLPVAVDKAMRALKYTPVRRVGSAGERAIVRDAPSELLAVLNSWRKQSRDRISVRRFEQMRPWMDGRFDNLVDNDVAWEEVIEVELQEERETFDLTVEEHHTFVAEGFITHNTEIAMRRLVLGCLVPPNAESHFFAAAPTWGQAKQIFWQHLRALSPRSMVTDWSDGELWIKYITGATLHVLGLDEPARIEGRPWDGGVLDEYGNMAPTVWGAHLRPIMAERGGWCWFIGVPEGRNHYYKLYLEARKKKNHPEWDVFSWPSSDILDPEELAKARAEMDEDLYAQEFEASFRSFRGQVYKPFNETTHTAPLLQYYDPDKPLILCFDFNVEPGAAVICQEMLLPSGYVGTGVIGQVHIPYDSNTPAVCRKLVADWSGHRGPILVYGDATGGQRRTSGVLGHDWKLVKQGLQGNFAGGANQRIIFKVPAANPPQREGINCMCARLKSADGAIRLMVDPNEAPEVVLDLEGVRYLEGGSGEIAKTGKVNFGRTHWSDSLQAYVVARFPIKSHSAANVYGMQPLALGG